MKHYTLNADGIPQHESDPKKWDDWFARTDRSVARSIIGYSQVSTQFLGFTWDDDQENPALWETVVLGGPLDQVKDRCAGDREQAEAMHSRMVERVRNHTPTEK